LNYIVFEDTRLAKGPEDGYRQDRDRDRSADRQAGAETNVDRDDSEEHAKKGTENQGAGAVSSGRLSLAGTKGLKFDLVVVDVAMFEVGSPGSLHKCLPLPKAAES
jgi:hypothetical protein